MTQDKINDCWNTIGVWGTQTPRCERLQELVHCRNCSIYNEAGQKLLSREADADYLGEWKSNLSEPRSEQQSHLLSALAFRVGDEWFSIASNYIREITHCDKHHTLPHRKNPVLRGLVNVRGNLLLNISIGYLFKVNRGFLHKKKDNERYIVIQDSDNTYAFPATEVREIIHYAEHDIMPAPSTFKKDTSCYLKGIVKYQDSDIGIINEELLFQALLDSI